MSQDKNKKYVDQLWLEETAAGVRIGLTNEAQEELGEISFVTFAKIGKELKTGDFLAELEAEKAVSELTSPLVGTVTKINEAAEKNPTLLDDSNESNAWLIELEQIQQDEFSKL